MAVATNTAGFVWTDGDGHEVVHRLQASLRFRSEAQYGRVQTRYRSFSLDQRTSETFTIAGGAEECTAMIRFDGDPFGLQELLAAGADGRTLTYRPNLAVNDEYELELMDYGDVAPASLDRGRFGFGEWEAPVRLRLMSGGSLESLVADRLAFVTGAGPMRHATFTRATTGTRINRNRMIESIAAGDRRVTWLERDGVLRPYGLHESARTNLVLRSQELDNATWTKVRSSVSADADTAPDDTTTADRLIEDSSAATTHYAVQNVTATADVTYAFSVFLKIGTRTFGQLRVWEVATPANHFRGTFDLTNRTAGTLAAGGTGTATRILVRPVVDDWVRCTIVGEVGNGATALAMLVLIAEGDDDVTFDGDGSSYIRWWGAQFEDNVLYPSSYMPTVASSFSRDADEMEVPHQHAPQASTGYWRFQELAAPNWVMAGGSAPRIFEKGTGAASPRLILAKPSGTAVYRLQHQTANGTVTSDVSLAPVPGDDIELFPQLYSDGAVQLHGRKNGGSISSGTKSAALALASAWSAEELHVASIDSAGSGDIALDLGAEVRTVLTPAAMLRRLSSQGVS